jgi:hypothetical protein
MTDELRLRIVLTDPPAGIDYALQSGSGNKYESIGKQVSGVGNLAFDLSVKLKTDKDALPDFAGPFVQGSKGERFIYIGIGTYAGNIDSPWGRRLKVPLKDISPAVIANVMAGKALVLETIVPGTDRAGGPTCATVKPFAGWHVATT